MRATRPDAGSDDEYGSDDDDLERDEGVIDKNVDSDEMGDNQGATDFNREKLTRTKITQQDYTRRAQSARTKKKGKYGVTVPRPFSCVMAKPKSKTIA